MIKVDRPVSKTKRIYPLVRPFNKVDLSYQDGGKTLKVFVEGLDKPDLL